MIVKENLEIGGKAFVKTYSDKGFYIERDGAKYSEAIDPANIERTYIETDEPINDNDELPVVEQKAAAYDYLTEYVNIGGEINA